MSLVQQMTSQLEPLFVHLWEPDQVTIVWGAEEEDGRRKMRRGRDEGED